MRNLWRSVRIHDGGDIVRYGQQVLDRYSFGRHFEIITAGLIYRSWDLFLQVQLKNESQ
jgi:hypothetical protein